MLQRFVFKFLFALLACLSFALLCSLFIQANLHFEPFFFRNGILQMSDFAYHLVIVDAFWFKGMTGIYQPLVQEQIISEFVKQKIMGSMPLGITPLALVIWFPFALLSHFNFTLAYISWITFSLAFLITSLLDALKDARYRQRPVLLAALAVTFVCIFSTTMAGSIALGQTSIIATGALLLLLRICQAKARKQKKRENTSLASLFLIFILAIKPSYLILGMLSLLVFRLWKEIFLSLGLLSVILLLLTVRLGPTWPHDYSLSLTTYMTSAVPQHYQSSIVPQTMNIFRSAFSDIIGDSLSLSISKMFFIGGTVCIAGLALVANLHQKENTSFRNSLAFILIALAIACYLLFSPYAGQYEDLLLLVSLTLLLPSPENKPFLKSRELILLLILTAIVLNFNIAASFWSPSILWAFKAAVLTSIPLILRRNLIRS